MHLLFYDYETYWSKTHNLKRLGPIPYVMHKDTEIISLSVAVNKADPVTVFGEDEAHRLLVDSGISKSYCIAHNNSGFDGLITTNRLKLRPQIWGCTLAMARPVYAKVCSLSLGTLVKRAGIGVKDNTVLMETQGKHLCDFTPDELRRMKLYNGDDTWQDRELFFWLLPHFTQEELWHLHSKMRAFLEPVFDLDVPLLETALSIERDQKRAKLLKVAAFLRQENRDTDLDWDDEDAVFDFVMSEMQSAPKLAKLLESVGVPPPMKRSPTNPEKFIPAFSKGDKGMLALVEHENELVAAAASARLAAKSTQLETRIESFLETFDNLGKLPVPVNYCGADTTGRDSGFLYNMLNLPKVNRKKPSHRDALRRAVQAPEGHTIGVRDSSGIELRVNHTLWQVARSMALWSADPNADLYVGTADDYYGLPPGTIVKGDPRRDLGKMLELSCGFGIGHVKLQDQARVQYGLTLTLEESERGVRSWRSRYPEIAEKDTGGWSKCEQALFDILDGREREVDPWGLVHTCREGLRLPSGRLIRYPELRRERVKSLREVDGELVERMEWRWMYGHGRDIASLYGGKVDENIVQALARDIVFGQAFAFYKETGWHPAHSVYDELAYVWPKAEAEALLNTLGHIMSQPPKWWPEIVLANEGSLAERYGDAK